MCSLWVGAMRQNAARGARPPGDNVQRPRKASPSPGDAVLQAFQARCILQHSPRFLCPPETQKEIISGGIFPASGSKTRFGRKISHEASRTYLPPRYGVEGVRTAGQKTESRRNGGDGNAKTGSQESRIRECRAGQKADRRRSGTSRAVNLCRFPTATGQNQTQPDKTGHSRGDETLRSRRVDGVFEA